MGGDLSGSRCAVRRHDTTPSTNLFPWLGRVAFPKPASPGPGKGELVQVCLVVGRHRPTVLDHPGAGVFQRRDYRHTVAAQLDLNAPPEANAVSRTIAQYGAARFRFGPKPLRQFFCRERATVVHSSSTIGTSTSNFGGDKPFELNATAADLDRIAIDDPDGLTAADRNLGRRLRRGGKSEAQKNPKPVHRREAKNQRVGQSTPYPVSWVSIDARVALAARSFSVASSSTASVSGSQTTP